MSFRILQRVILCVAVVTAAAFGQSGPTFDVASIKKAEPMSVNTVMSGKLNMGMTIDNAMVNIKAMSITEMLRYAYKVKSFQISGPAWLNMDRWDIVAKMPSGASRDDIPAMVQALLAERFKLTLHRSTTDQAVYALVVTKPGLLKESPPDDPAAAAPSSGPAAPLAATPTDGGAQVRAAVSSDTSGTVSSASINGNMKMLPRENGMRMQMTKMTMTGMEEVLGRFVDHPVVNMTGLNGRYDLDIDIGLDDMIRLAQAAGMNVPIPRSDPGHATDPAGSGVFNAIQQYGLKLEPRRAPIDLLIIDHVEKTPTEN